MFWVCQLSPAWYNIECSQCLNLTAINFNWSTWPWSIVQWGISSTKLCKALLTRSIRHGLFSTRCTNHFLHFSCVFTFLEIKCQKHCISSSIFNIKMATQKFTNFDKFFKKCTLIWQLWQYDLTELFWIKLRQLREPSYGKNQTNFLANPIYNCRS